MKTFLIAAGLMAAMFGGAPAAVAAPVSGYAPGIEAPQSRDDRRDDATAAVTVGTMAVATIVVAIAGTIVAAIVGAGTIAVAITSAVTAAGSASAAATGAE